MGVKKKKGIDYNRKRKRTYINSNGNKTYYKPKYKGVRYITTALRKRYPKRYIRRSEYKLIAEDLIRQCIWDGKKVTIRNCFFYLPKREKKIPVLPDELLSLTSYYNLQDYISIIQGMPENPRLMFISHIFPLHHEPVEAGFEYDYSVLFAPFVNHIDSLRKLSAEGLYEEEWYIRCMNPEWDKELSIYYSEIISCDILGDKMNYQFDRESASPIGPLVPLNSEGKNTESAAPVVPDDNSLLLEKEKNRGKELDIELDKMKIQKADKMLELIKAGVPYNDAKKLLGL